MPCSITIPVSYNSLLKSNFTLQIHPFLSTMEVRTFYNIFGISSTVTQKLIVPKGIETIDSLPVEFVILYYKAADHWLAAEDPEQMIIHFWGPDFYFMPKIQFK